MNQSGKKTEAGNAGKQPCVFYRILPCGINNCCRYAQENSGKAKQTGNLSIFFHNVSVSLLDICNPLFLQKLPHPCPSHITVLLFSYFLGIPRQNVSKNCSSWDTVGTPCGDLAQIYRSQKRSSPYSEPDSIRNFFPWNLCSIF